MKDFYQENAARYHQSTVDVDSGEFLKPLLEYLDEGSTVLDVGCGSGRDLLWLKKNGYIPTGLEKAKALADMAHKHSHCLVLEGDFHTFEFEKYAFDAIILVGSLVHVEAIQLKHLLSKILTSLKPNGILFISLKYGKGKEFLGDGRVFQLWQPSDLESIFSESNLTILSFEMKDSNVRSSDRWLGYFLKSNNR